MDFDYLTDRIISWRLEIKSFVAKNVLVYNSDSELSNIDNLKGDIPSDSLSEFLGYYYNNQPIPYILSYVFFVVINIAQFT